MEKPVSHSEAPPLSMHNSLRHPRRWRFGRCIVLKSVCRADSAARQGIRSSGLQWPRMTGLVGMRCLVSPFREHAARSGFVRRNRPEGPLSAHFRRRARHDAGCEWARRLRQVPPAVGGSTMQSPPPPGILSMPPTRVASLRAAGNAVMGLSCGTTQFRFRTQEQTASSLHIKSAVALWSGSSAPVSKGPAEANVRKGSRGLAMFHVKQSHLPERQSPSQDLALSCSFQPAQLMQI